jgi:hypothetical protein
MRRVSLKIPSSINKAFTAGLTLLLLLAPVGSSFLTGTAYASPVLGETVITLNWVGRNTEGASTVPFGAAVGSKVGDGLALPLDTNQTIFDNGDHTPAANKAAIASGVQWASWPQWHSSCLAGTEVRHLRATFNLPAGAGTVFDVILFSPYYAAHGNIIPLNDNIYVYLNGTPIGNKGCSYGSVNVGGGGTAPFANETDGWYQDGSFGTAAASALVPGLNTIDIVVEEICSFGGIGRLNLKLLTSGLSSLEVPVDVKPTSCPNPLNISEKGWIPVAVLGTGDFDVTRIDPASVKLEGISPIRWSLEDVATPFEPFTGKAAEFDCNTLGPDGHQDLTFRFDHRSVVAALGAVTSGQVLVVKLTGNLKAEYGGTLIMGEDVVIMRKR